MAQGAGQAEAFDRLEPGGGEGGTGPQLAGQAGGEATFGLLAFGAEDEVDAARRPFRLPAPGVPRRVEYRGEIRDGLAVQPVGRNAEPVLQAEGGQFEAGDARPTLPRLPVRRVGQHEGRGGVAVEVDLGVGPAQRAVDRDRRRKGVAALRPDGGRGQAVALARAVARVGGGDPVCRCVGDPGGEGAALADHPDREAAAAGPERARLDIRRQPVGLAGGEGDHPADGVRAPQRRLRPGQHLDAFDIGEVEAAEVEGAVDLGRVVDRDAVDEDESLAGAGPADAHLGDAAEGARAHHRQPRHVGQDIGGEDGAAAVDGVAGQHPRAGRVLGDGRQARGGDHHLVQRIGGVVGRPGVSGQGKQHGRGRGEEKGSLHGEGSVGPRASAPRRLADDRSARMGRRWDRVVTTVHRAPAWSRAATDDVGGQVSWLAGR